MIDEFKSVQSFFATKRQKPSRSTTICIVFIAKIATEALFLGHNLHQHNHHKRNKNHQRLPCPQPHASGSIINETSCQHWISAQTVRTIGHKMFGSRCYFVSECIHRITITYVPHIHNRPNAQHQTYTTTQKPSRRQTVRCRPTGCIFWQLPQHCPKP